MGKEDGSGSWWRSTRVQVEETHEKAEEFLDGDDGSCYNGSQRRCLKKPRQQVPQCLKAELPKAAHLEAAWRAPKAACGPLPNTQLPPSAPAAASPLLHGRALRCAQTRTSGPTMTRRCACAAEAADHNSQERWRAWPRPVPPSHFPAGPRACAWASSGPPSCLGCGLPNLSTGRGSSCTEGRFERALGPSPSRRRGARSFGHHFPLSQTGGRPGGGRGGPPRHTGGLATP